MAALQIIDLEEEEEEEVAAGYLHCDSLVTVVVVMKYW